MDLDLVGLCIGSIPKQIDLSLIVVSGSVVALRNLAHQLTELVRCDLQTCILLCLSQSLARILTALIIRVRRLRGLVVPIDACSTLSPGLFPTAWLLRLNLLLVVGSVADL